MSRLVSAALAAMTLWWAGAAQAAAPDTAQAYAAQWPLTVPAGASLVRLPLPAEVLTRLQTSDLRDLRIFNAAGQAVPTALDRSDPRAGEPTPLPITLPVLPILADAATASGGDFALRIEEGPGGRVVKVDSHAVAPASAAVSGAVLTGVLVDTRTQTARLRAIELDAQWPAARPFAFDAHTSSDLQHWTPLGRVMAFRGADGGVLAPATVALNGESLKDRYLRLSWDPSTTPNAVQIGGVRLQPMGVALPPVRVAVDLVVQPVANDPKLLEWRLPFATPVAALGVRTEGATALVPVRILARQQREAPWTPLGQLVVFNLAQGGQTQYNAPLELGQATWREWRVEADPTSPGFTAAPRITAWLAPAQLVFVASGDGPFTLAAGRADAPAVALPLPSLIPGYEPGAPARLPQATLVTATIAGASAALPTTAPGDPLDRRRWLLWAVLIGGVLLLAGMAWVLVRQMNRPTVMEQNQKEARHQP